MKNRVALLMVVTHLLVACGDDACKLQNNCEEKEKLSAGGTFDNPDHAAKCQDTSLFVSPGDQVFINGRLVASFPAEYASAATTGPAVVAESAKGFNALSAYLGIDLDVPCLHFRYSYGSSMPNFSGVVANTAATINYSIRRGATLSSGHSLIQERIGDIHEMTHAFVHDTPLPVYANEGLAEYLPDLQRTGAYRDFESQVRCDGAGMAIAGSGVWNERPYSQYAPQSTWGADAIYYYYSAGCMWKWIEDNHGQGGLQRVVAALASMRYQQGSFLRDAVRNVLGGEAADHIQSVWGITEASSQ